MGDQRRTRLEVRSTWDGEAIAEHERATFDLVLSSAALDVAVDAPFVGDPPPPGPAGAHDGLWEFEVVELFLLGRDDRYLEIELGPHGHHLVLALRGERRVERSGLPIDYRCEIDGARFRGEARVPTDWLPPGLERANAYAIRGVGAARRYMAAHPLGGDAPDFHRLADFRPIAWSR